MYCHNAFVKIFLDAKGRRAVLLTRKAGGLGLAQGRKGLVVGLCRCYFLVYFSPLQRRQVAEYQHRVRGMRRQLRGEGCRTGTGHWGTLQRRQVAQGQHEWLNISWLNE